MSLRQSICDKNGCSLEYGQPVSYEIQTAIYHVLVGALLIKKKKHNNNVGLGGLGVLRI